MFSQIVNARGIALAVAVSGVAFAPVSAHAGFLDELFGGAPQAPVAAPQAPFDGFSQQPNDVDAPRAHRAERTHPKKKVAQVAKTPVLQMTTDLMSDKTLRPGDAVMMRTGVHVYDGPEASHHDADQFVALDDADGVKAKTRSELVAMDATRRNPLVFAANAPGTDTPTISEGRSVATTPAVVPGYKITDARGRSIRYVGP